MRAAALFPGLLLLCVTVGTAAAQERLACDGPFGRESSHALLVKTFGAKNVAYRKVRGAEGERIWASVLYPNSAKKRLEFIWNDVKARRRPSIRIEGASGWGAPNGIRIGIGLTDIEKFNGKPFKISGFNWDYGGQVTDWEGGALSYPVVGGCHVDIDFSLDKSAPDAAIDKVSGESNFASDNPSMLATKAKVSTIILTYPEQ
jgi:hypothetical protein